MALLTDAIDNVPGLDKDLLFKSTLYYQPYYMLYTTVPSVLYLFPLEITTNWPGEKPSESIFDRSVLPSAPRASQALQIDRSRLPRSPPYTVYLGNLSYECSEEDIKRFFDRKKLSVRKYLKKATILEA